MIYAPYACFRGASTKNMLPVLFNVVMVAMGIFILLMFQGHACSLPGNEVGEFATGKHPYCPRLGGLRRSTDEGLKLHVGWTIALEIVTALFLLMSYWSMIFTSKLNQDTIDKLCVEDRFEA